MELADTYFRAARERFASDSSVTLYHGESSEILRQMRPALGDRSTLFWLDAHWCLATGTAGERSQCPLLSELAAISSLNDQSVVLIDDARLFVATPPAPHETSNWPRFGQVLNRLSALSPEHEVMIVNDVIVFFPPQALEAVTNYARSFGVDWLARTHRLVALEQENAVMATALDERLAAIDNLTKIAEERGALIEEFDRQAREIRDALG